MIRCSELFTDNMILQRHKTVCVWGETDSTQEVCVAIDGFEVKAEILNGKWIVYIPAHEEGGPYTLSVRQGEQSITFNRVMYGEVFVASGQSNMEMKLIDSENGELEAAKCECEDIRYFNVLKIGYTDGDALEQMRESQWTCCTDGNAGEMSAVAYYAAKKIYEKMSVPIGIIDCYQGGTSICSWLPEEILENYTLGRERIREYKALVGDKTDEEYDREVQEYWKSWHRWDDLVKSVKQTNPNATYEEITAVAGECPWPQPAGRKSVFRPAGCYESMIKRVAPYTVNAVVYYQGETDEDKAKAYLPVMEALIKDWRKQFRDDQLYFVVTQLPMYKEKDAVDNCSWAVIRDSQLTVYENMTNMGFLSIVDCGELGNIHPVDKKTPGVRLGKLLLEELYGMEDQGQAMLPGKIYKQGDDVIIECKNTYGSIQIKPVDDEELSLAFEVSKDGEDYEKCNFHIEENMIVLSGENVKAACKVRYGWTNYGLATIFNEAGIPLVTFGARDIR